MKFFLVRDRLRVAFAVASGAGLGALGLSKLLPEIVTPAFAETLKTPTAVSIGLFLGCIFTHFDERRLGMRDDEDPPQPR